MKTVDKVKLQQATRWVLGKFIRGAVILHYHRVAEYSSDPQLLCVTPQHFSEHLEILRKVCKPMRLLDLVGAAQNGEIPDCTVAVTFDDGYADNLYIAKPLLERYDIPATVFVATEPVWQEGGFWWDVLESVVLYPGRLPETLQVHVRGETLRFGLDKTANYGETDYQRYRLWDVESKDTPTQRHDLYRSLVKVIRPLPAVEREQVLDNLLSCAGSGTNQCTTHRVLSPEEVLRLAEGELVEIGAHTVTHSILSSLHIDEQWAEIHGSKNKLEGILNRPINSFAYPFGTRSDYTGATVSMVQRAGFKLACSNFPGPVWRRTDPFQLPRLLVRDWDGEEFTRQIRRYIRA